MSTAAHPAWHGEAESVLRDARVESRASGRRSQVWRATFDDGRPSLAVKLPVTAGRTDAEAGEAARLVHDEASRLAWLAEHVPVRGLAIPEVVVAPEPDDPSPILVTTWLAGEVDPRLLSSPGVAVVAFGRALAVLHDASRSLDLDGCPFDASLATHLGAAARRVDDGLVDTAALDDPFDRYEATDLLERARRLAGVTRAPDATDRVLVHGDLCVSNLLLDPGSGTAVGAVDWAWAGVGDRHLDLAVTARSLARNFSGEVLPDFFAAYGELDPDPLRLEAYALIEELF